jgi:multicomponent Na+:H+ antiporter subunit E
MRLKKPESDYSEGKDTNSDLLDSKEFYPKKKLISLGIYPEPGLAGIIKKPLSPSSPKVIPHKLLFYNRIASIKSIFGFTLVLSAFWLINSGCFDPLLLGFGVLSIIIVDALIFGMKHKDGESFPLIIPAWNLPFYLLWMIGQIFTANIDVAKRVWLGQSSIDPVVFAVKTTQKTALARVLYANSITITPGTITLLVDDDVLEVHALTREAAEGLLVGEMDRRVTALEVA